jgi:PilZ domain
VSGSDRRKNPRFEADVPVRLTVDGHAYVGRLRDVCRDAALVEAHGRWPLGTAVILAMELPGTEWPLQVGGTVIRVGPGEGDATATAVLFGDLTPAAETRIDFFIALRGGSVPPAP